MVFHCVKSAVDQGALSREQGDELIREFDSLVQANLASGAFNEQLAATMAKQTMAQSREADLAIRKLRIVRQAQANSRLAAMLAGHEDVQGRVDALFTPSAKANHTDVQSLEYRIRYYNSLALARMAEGMGAIRRTFRGDVQRVEQLDILRAANGISTGNRAAEAFAHGYRQAEDMLADAMRLQGAAIPKSEVRDLPHVHSAYKVGRVTREEWVDFVMPMLDREKMRVKLHDVDPRNYSGLPMTDEELRKLLGEIYETIRSKGLNKQMPGFRGEASVANKYNQERILHFKDDTWFAYNERFGETDIATAMMKNIQNMSRELAMMEVFGPNLSVGKEALKLYAQREIQSQKNEFVRANGNVEPSGNIFTSRERFNKAIGYDDFASMEDGIGRHVDRWFDIADGRTFGNINNATAKIFDNARGFLASAQLGSAMLSALGDFGSMGWTARFNGMEFSKVMQTYFKALVANNSKEDLRVFAAELGLVVEHLQANMLQHTIYELDQHNTIGSVLADKVLRWSGLTRHTETMRIAFTVDMAQEIAKNFAREFSQLDRKFQRGLRMNGIDTEMWDAIRASTPIVKDGVPHVNVADVGRTNSEAAQRLFQYIESELDKAVITSGWKFERFAADWLPSGQLGKMASMYKRYPVLLFQHHIGRMMSPEMTGFERAGYVFGFVSTMTVLGAVGLTLKDLAAGRDPRSWDDKSFWADAFISGGSGGLLGDFIKSGWDATRQKRSADIFTAIAGTYFGPVVGAINDIATPYQAMLLGLSNGDSADTIAAATNAAAAKLTKYVPGNNLWQTRVFVDRWFEDNVQRMINPDHGKFFRKQIENRKRYYDQEFWWKPGESLPSRAPYFGE